MKNFRIIKLSKKVIIFQLRISKHKLLELQLEFNIWDIIKFSVEFFPKSISLWIFGFELYLGIINIIFSLQDNREFTESSLYLPLSVLDVYML